MHPIKIIAITIMATATTAAIASAKWRPITSEGGVPIRSIKFQCDLSHRGQFMRDVDGRLALERGRGLMCLVIENKPRWVPVSMAAKNV